MQNELNAYIAKIKADYLDWKGELTMPHHQQMIDDFNKSIRIEEGKKFVKIVTDGSVHSFIVKEDMPKFKKGTILKAASWSAPAKNYGRGNILDGNYTVRWTGVAV
jgi:hypothetical protein